MAHIKALDKDLRANHSVDLWRNVTRGLWSLWESAPWEIDEEHNHALCLDVWHRMFRDPGSITVSQFLVYIARCTEGDCSGLPTDPTRFFRDMTARELTDFIKSFISEWIRDNRLTQEAIRQAERDTSELMVVHFGACRMCKAAAALI